jgi:hypothetical protein
MGTPASMAGSPLAQQQGSDVQKGQQDTADQARQTQMNAKAEQAAGVGETEQDEQASDRDADGRRLWERTGRAGDPEAADQADSESGEAGSRDPTGQSGQNLDLSG